MRLLGLAAALGVLVRSGAAIDLVLEDEESVKSAAATIAFGLVKYYTGNNTGDTPGNLPDPYFWWEAGAMFGTLIDYWALTGDDSYNNITTQAILHQATENGDFMPANQTRTLGNDDQGFWGMAALSAAENNYPNPPSDQPQWLALAQSLFNQYASRWDETTCGGGLRWQIFTFNNGYNYKNSISNGCFFNIAARLARYTGNETYAEWASKIWTWQETVGLISADYHVHDGTNINLTDNTCTAVDKNEWTYNSGIFLHGAAVMYNHTNGSSTWRERVDGLLAAAQATFFTNNSVMVEQLCEPAGVCDNDQRSFKGYLTRWLAGTTQMAPHTAGPIRALLAADATAAAKACVGNPGAPAFKGHAGTACGFRWDDAAVGGGFDGSAGVGEQMNALSAVMYTLVTSSKAAAPVTADTGGTSKGNPAGKAHQPGGVESESESEISVGERVAAGFVTSAIALGVVAGCAFVIS
ncbi:62d736f5-4126-47c7-b97f-c67911be9199 [Thermothielavioides terrestris]|uniref:Mannan endo-1,6-alpha-mannosidase n=1 Tax=Thermothielavioides terrestris TaxID=2587410 RepID=A0A3S4BIJ9_9PEZI|nr:62d736f5-4126-47c7-b97f-c67911be9199 [Thermothielavioides terrestris]